MGVETKSRGNEKNRPQYIQNSGTVGVGKRFHNFSIKGKNSKRKYFLFLNIHIAKATQFCYYVYCKIISFFYIL